MLDLPKCGECSVYANLFCPYKDPERETCIFAPMLTDFYTEIFNYLKNKAPMDPQEICVRFIEKLNHEKLTR